MSFTIPDFGPSDLLTSAVENERRIKVEQSRTGLIAGKQFRMIRKITSPIAFKFVSPVPFILLGQNLSITNGEFEYYAYRSANVVESTAFDDEVYVIRKNALNLDYTMQATIYSGGTFTLVDDEDYVDYISLKTSSASGHRESLSAGGDGERILPAGTYYLRFTGTATGSISLEWEEIA